MSHTPRRRATGARIVTAAVAAAAAVAVLVPSAAGAHGRAHAAAAPACKAQQLVNWLNTNANGAAGTVYYELQFTNIGRACTLRGYPGVSAVSISGHQIGKPARRVTGLKVRTVTVRSGRTARAAVGIEEAGALPASKCHPAQAGGLRVFAPNAAAATVIPFPLKACSTGTSSLVIRPVG
jgi:Protein of unknown function (DUF4232)